MKTAVIYSGQARTFERCFPNHEWHLFSKLGDFEIFASMECSPEASRMCDLLDTRYGKLVNFEAFNQPELPEPPPAPPLVAMYPPSSPPQAILRQFWALDQAWEFFTESTCGEFDRIIRIRPDIAFASLDVPRAVHTYDCWTPWWARWGGLNDRFAVLGFGAASLYFTTYRQISRFTSMGCPLHPETLLKARFDEHCNPQFKLSTLFVTVRQDGTMVQPSITVEDYAEYARS